VQTACRRALVSAFIGTPPQLELLAPGERHSVSDLVATWAANAMSETMGGLLAAGQRAEVFEWGSRVVKLSRSAGGHAHSREDVNLLHELLLKIGATVLNPPADYPTYGEGYYAVFFSDPDGIKLEFVYVPPNC